MLHYSIYYFGPIESRIEFTLSKLITGILSLNIKCIVTHLIGDPRQDFFSLHIYFQLVPFFSIY